MPRRPRSIFSSLMVLPWWVSVSLSVIAYIALAIVVPSIEFHSPLYQGLQLGLPRLAPILAFVLLLPAPISAFNAWRKRKQLDIQKGIDTIRNLTWNQFEELVAEAYLRKGYTVIENQRGGADGGIDLKLKKGGALCLVQCKHWKSQKVGVSTVRELYGVMAAEGAAAGIVVCTGKYTHEAIV